MSPPREGEDFFLRSRENGPKLIPPEDLESFLASFTMENVMAEIARGEVFELRYHLVINGEPRPVSLRATLVKEADGEKLIVGVNSLRQQKE